jgi:hypothetical protein
MGSVRNGSGDDVFVLFNATGCFLKGFSHEYPNPSISAEAYYADVPEAFGDAAREPAFSPDNVSFCAWRRNDGSAWQSSVDAQTLNPRMFFLLENLDGDPAGYKMFAEDYYERDIDLDAVAGILRGEPISPATAKTLNADAAFDDLRADLNEIGFPIVE